MLSVETFDTVSQASQQMRDGSQYIAGGTLVMRAVNYGDQSFTRIVRSIDPALRAIRIESGRVVIGAGVTMAEVIQSRDLDFLSPVARLIGGPAIRNMATVGGNLFAANPYGDFTTALLALDGEVIMAEGAKMPLEQFLSSRETVRGLVSAVSVPRPNDDDFRFRKVSRVKPKGVAVMSIAAWLQRAGSRVNQARVAFGGMGAIPLRAKTVEAALNGAALDANGIERAIAVATDGLDPQDDALASAWYRREVAPVHLRRTLLGENS